MAYLILCTVVCWVLDIVCRIAMGSAGSGVLICMYYCVLTVAQFVWECEGVSRKWRTEFYVLM